MSGEAVGVIIVPIAIVAIPVGIAALAIKGAAGVVGAIAESEKRRREEQRRLVEADAARYTSAARVVLEAKIAEIEQRKQDRLRSSKSAKVPRPSQVIGPAREISQTPYAMSDLKRENLKASCSRLHAELANVAAGEIRSRVGDEIAGLGESIEAAESSDLAECGARLERLVARVRQIVSHGYDAEEEKARAEILVDEILDLLDFHDAVRGEATPLRTEIDASLMAITSAHGHGADARYQRQQLEGVLFRVREAESKARRKRGNQIAALEEEIRQIATLAAMLVEASGPEDQPAREVQSALTGALREKKVSQARAVVALLGQRIQELYRAYLERTKVAAERSYVMQSAAEVLADMGYSVTRPDYQEAPVAEAPHFMEVQTPGGEGVRLAFQDDKGLHAQVFHPDSAAVVSPEVMRTHEKNWCDDLTLFQGRMRERGLDIKLERRDLDDEEIARISSMSGFVDADEEEGPKHAAVGGGGGERG